MTPGRWARGWHLLSLDAPTVAALWAWFFAHVHHLRLPSYSVPLLALGTWLFYVVDRILDGLAGTAMRPRHRFHLRHRRAFLLAAVAAGLLLACLVAVLLPAVELRDYTVLGLLALLYLWLVHVPDPRWRRALPKELVVGAVFAAVTAVPAASRLHDAGQRLGPTVALFALLCWLNCVAIEVWESDAAELATAHASTRWLGTHLRWAALALTVLALAQGAALGLAVAASALLLAALDAARSHLSPLRLRIATDAAMLTPLLAFLPIL